MHYLQKKQQELISNKIVEFSFALKKYLNSTVSYVHCTALLWIPLSGFGPIILCGISENCHFSYLVFFFACCRIINCFCAVIAGMH